MQFEKQQQTW